MTYFSPERITRKLVGDLARAAQELDRRFAFTLHAGAALVAPNVRFPAIHCYLEGDPELGLACVRAWNDWHLDYWAGTYPGRMIPLQIPWLKDVEVAAEDVRRNAERGFQAVSFADDFAPEHLLIVTEDSARVAEAVRNAGAVFVGPYATVPLGDYTAGPNHTLPTSGAARFASPLGVHTFLKRTSVLSLSRGDVETLHDATVRLAHLEGLGAHAHAVEVRLE